ncbi:MAG: class I SAM-dependent methyltransferase [Limisphaerales bacterium]
MGIAKSAARYLMREAKRQPFSGRVLSLGRQDIGFSHDTLKRVARDTSFQLSGHKEIRLSRKKSMAALDFIADDSFFHCLGFESSEAMDFSAYEEADHVFDLNEAELPEKLVGQFDMVVDGGTMEHVFHTPNLLKNVFRLLKPGGRMVHMAPSSNHTDHGFYMFSPTFVWDYYHSNGWEVNSCELVRYDVLNPVGAWSFYRYEPGALQDAANGELGSGMYAVFSVCTKTDKSTHDRVPVQGRPLYEATLNAERGEQAPVEAPKADEEPVMSPWKIALAKNPLLGPLAFRAQNCLRALARLRLRLAPVPLERVDRY